MLPSQVNRPVSPPSEGAAKADELPKLPVPKLEDTVRRYLRALEVRVATVDVGTVARWHRWLTSGALPFGLGGAGPASTSLDFPSRPAGRAPLWHFLQ